MANYLDILIETLTYLLIIFLGRQWWEGFRKHHPKVTQCMPSSLSAVSSNVTKDSIQEWFAAARRYIAEKIDGGPQALRDLRCVFNCDESGFPLDSNTGRIKAVLAKKGARHVMK